MTRLQRIAPLAGIIAVASFVAEAIISGDTPKVDAPAQEVVSYWSSNIGTQEAAAALFGLAAITIVWFGGSLRSALGRAGADAERLGALAFAGTVIIAAGLSLYASIGLAAAHSVGDVPSSTTQTLNVLGEGDLFMPLAVGAALLLLSTSVAVLRHGGLPRWVGGMSLGLGVVAVVSVVLGAASTGSGFIAFLALVPWVPTIAIVLYRDQVAEPS